MAKRKYKIVKCPSCQSENTISKGWKDGKLRRECKDCRKSFYSKKPETTVKKIKQIPPKPVKQIKCSKCGKIVCVCAEKRKILLEGLARRKEQERLFQEIRIKYEKQQKLSL